MATARPGLRSATESPPGQDEKSPRTWQVSPQRSRLSPRNECKGSHLHHSPSPIRAERSPNLEDANDFEDSEEEIREDEVDRGTPKHDSHLYPDLNVLSSGLLSDKSPGGAERSPSLDGSFTSDRTQCYVKRGKGHISGENIRSRNRIPPETPPRHPLSDVEKEAYLNVKFGPNPLLAILIFVIICCAFIFALQVFLSSKRSVAPKESVNKTIEEIAKDVKRDLRVLHHRFPQTKHLWTQMMGELRTMLVPSPTYPTVILFLVPRGAERTAACLIQNISYVVKTAFEDLKSVSFDVRSHMKNSTWLKFEMDLSLKELSNSHVVTIYNVELMPGNAAMILHAYCDNENAPFKQVAFLLTLEVDKSYEEIETSLDSTVNTILNQVWATELESKDIAAIISRIGNAPVAVQPVRRETLDSVCPL